MCFEYCIKICPYWNCSLKGKIKCLVSEEFCSFNFAKDKYLDCMEYISTVASREIKIKIKEG